MNQENQNVFRKANPLTRMHRSKSVLLTGLCMLIAMTAQAQIYTQEVRFGSRGEGNGQFRDISDIALDVKGNVHVADQYCIQKFSNSGKFLSKFGSRGDSNGQFKWGTSGVAVDRASGDILVSDWANDAPRSKLRGASFMKAYSPDLRQRIIASLEEGTTNQAAAQRFGVSLSSVKRYKRSGKTQATRVPKPIAGRPPHIKDTQHETFRELVASRTDWTLETLAQAWKEQTGVKPNCTDGEQALSVKQAILR